MKPLLKTKKLRKAIKAARIEVKKQAKAAGIRHLKGDKNRDATIEAFRKHMEG